jgi:hypothetical protein
MSVGLDAATEGVLMRALGRDESYTVSRSVDLASARAALDDGIRPTILVIEASMLHKLVMFPPFVHVVALAGPDRAEARAFGADEIVRRPLHADDLAARLRLAARALARDFQMTPSQTLRLALADGRAGELIVSRQDDLGRVHVEPGKIAWVHRPRHAVSIRGLLGEVGNALADETIRDIVEESRRTRRHFADVLVEWEVAPREVVREQLRQHVAAELAVILQWTDATATFVEDRRASTSTFAFDTSEVWATPQPSKRSETLQGMVAVRAEPLPDPARVQSWLDRIAAVPHVLGCALLDTRIGQVLGSRGSLSEDTDVAWEMAGGFSALGPTAEEILATTKTSAFLVRSTRPEIPAVGVVTFDPQALSPAMARILVSKVS